MPCKPSPKSLKQLGLDSVAMNLEFLCYGCKKGSEALGRLIESDEFKLYASPFSDWPSELLQQLSLTVYSKRSGLRHLLYQVIQPQITNYTIMLHGSIHVAMDLVARRCKDLVTLEMTYSVNLPPIYYVNFFSNFPKLTQLNLFGSMVDDNAFRVIGETCHRLSDLNASQTWITNLGLQYLSYSEETGLPLCQKLLSLNVLETRITPKGISLFLQYHPKIFRIEHAEMFQIFRRSGVQDNKSVSFNLTKLTSTSITLDPTQYNLALESCLNKPSQGYLNYPGISKVVNKKYYINLALSIKKLQSTVASAGLSNENLYKLMPLKHLQSLHLRNTNSLSFPEGLAPVLDACGSGLRKLVLESFSEVDVTFLGEKCRNIEHLALSGTTSCRPVNAQNPDLFRKLTNLEIWGGKGGSASSVGSGVIKQLMLNAPLARLLFQNVATVNDSLLLRILEANPMSTLANVVLDQCHDVTGTFFWKLLELPNQLRILRCWNCRRVTEAERTEIKRAIKDSNLTLYWEWYPYCEMNQDDIAHEWEEYEVQG